MNFWNQLPKRFGAKGVTDLKAKNSEFSKPAAGQELKGSNYLRSARPVGGKGKQVFNINTNVKYLKEECPESY